MTSGDYGYLGIPVVSIDRVSTYDASLIDVLERDFEVLVERSFT
jgi:hypothetical protein